MKLVSALWILSLVYIEMVTDARSVKKSVSTRNSRLGVRRGNELNPGRRIIQTAKVSNAANSRLKSKKSVTGAVRGRSRAETGGLRQSSEGSNTELPRLVKRLVQSRIGVADLDYSRDNQGLYSRGKAFVNRGIATGKYLYDVAMSPECRQYIICLITAAFGDEVANNVRFKDVRRTSARGLDMSGKVGNQRMSRSVKVGDIPGACVPPDPSIDCPALEPAFGKMNDLLNHFGASAGLKK